jgi:hypothetical protein
MSERTLYTDTLPFTVSDLRCTPSRETWEVETMILVSSYLGTEGRLLRKRRFGLEL